MSARSFETTFNYATAADRIGNRPIILINPADRGRPTIVATLSTLPGTVYYALTEADAGEPIAAISAGIIGQRHPTAPHVSFESADVAGRVLAVELSADHCQRLIIDGADYLGDSQIDGWLTGLAGWLANGQLIVAGRSIRLINWQAALDDGRAAIWSPDSIDQFDSADQFEPADRLTVSGFGRGQVWYGGQTADNWDGPLARRVFYFLIDQSPVSRDQVFAIFWADLSIREATNVFHVTKRKVNETVGCEAMLFQNRRYVINPVVKLRYDVHRFETAVREAQAAIQIGDTNTAHRCWQAAADRYRQPFLSQESMPWIVRRRDQLREQYAEALAYLAHAAYTAHDSDRALTGWLRAIAEQPLREDWIIAAMTLFAERGDLAAVRQQYDRLRGQIEAQGTDRDLIMPGVALRAAYRALIGEPPPEL